MINGLSVYAAQRITLQLAVQNHRRCFGLPPRDYLPMSATPKRAGSQHTWQSPKLSLPTFGPRLLTIHFILSLQTRPMLCEKHRARLQYVTHGGKRVLRCPYSHKKHYEAGVGPSCKRCGKSGVYQEGLCYPCWYYR